MAVSQISRTGWLRYHTTGNWRALILRDSHFSFVDLWRWFWFSRGIADHPGFKWYIISNHGARWTGWMDSWADMLCDPHCQLMFGKLHDHVRTLIRMQNRCLLSFFEKHRWYSETIFPKGLFWGAVKSIFELYKGFRRHVLMMVI